MLNVSRDQEKIQIMSANILAAFSPSFHWRMKIPALDYCYQISNLLKIAMASVDNGNLSVILLLLL